MCAWAPPCLDLAPLLELDSLLAPKRDLMEDRLTHYTIVLIGCGQMGSAIARRLVNAEHISSTRLICVDANASIQRALCAELSSQEGLAAVQDARNTRRVFIIAVKPRNVQGVLEGLSLTELDHVVSVAAGVDLATLSMWAGHLPRIVRTMPNTPVLVGRGTTGLMAAPGADVEAISALFEAVGTVVVLKDESQFHALTAISGSGPAYVFVALEALADAGVLMGLDRESSRALASSTLIGATCLSEASDAHTAELKDRVASPGGTTIAGLVALEAHGFRHALIEAVRAAATRSKEMTDQFNTP